MENLDIKDLQKFYETITNTEEGLNNFGVGIDQESGKIAVYSYDSVSIKLDFLIQILKMALKE